MTMTAPAPSRRRQPRPPDSGDEALSVFSSVFTMVAICSLWFVAQMLFLGGLAQERSQDLLYDEYREQLAAATAPIGPGTDPGRPVALLSIPDIGLHQVVVEGTASGDLLAGPGHRRDSVLPGQAGASVVYGRASTYGAPFAQLADLTAGDRIDVVSGQGSTTYTVRGVRRAGDPLPSVLEPEEGGLTLVTGQRSGWWSALSPGQVMYVDAVTRKPFPAPHSPPVVVPESEKAFAMDAGALPLLVLCLAALIALTLGVIAARQRWSTALVWVIASPVAVALSWMSTDVVMRLLPNLM